MIPPRNTQTYVTSGQPGPGNLYRLPPFVSSALVVKCNSLPVVAILSLQCMWLDQLGALRCSGAARFFLCRPGASSHNGRP